MKTEMLNVFKNKSREAMKIATWNVQKIGPHISIKDMLSSLLIEALDIIVLTGYPHDADFHVKLPGIGLKHCIASEPGRDHPGVLIATKTPFSTENKTADHPWIEADLPAQNMTILAFHIPRNICLPEKELLWQEFIRYTQKNSNEPVLLIGDLCINEEPSWNVFKIKAYFQNLKIMGWTDAWRCIHPMTYESIWFSNIKKRFEMNFIFLSPLLKERLINAYRLQYPPGKKASQSDNTLLLVELGF